MKIRIISILLLLSMLVQTNAQQQKDAIAQPTPDQIAQEEKVQRMLSATQRIMFIDSMVVSKSDFLRAYRMSRESGQIAHSNQLLRSEAKNDCFGFLNELGTKCYFSRYDTDSTSNIYRSIHENGQWTSPNRLKGINDQQQFKQVNFPYMLSDGQTLYFSATGDDGLGGYDIYMTTYDDEEDCFLQPVNIGMPFNSEGNDYLYVIDEYDSLGWFATDRRQPEGKVCVYTFLPNKVRQTYDSGKYTPDEIAGFAQISSIRRTWDDKRRLRTAQKRLHTTANAGKVRSANDRPFVINDRLTYHTATDFRNQQAGLWYNQWLRLKKERETLSANLQKARNYYAVATPEERSQLYREIIADEQRKEALLHEIRHMEKSIRNEEIIYLTNHQ